METFDKLEVLVSIAHELSQKLNPEEIEPLRRYNLLQDLERIRECVDRSRPNE